MQVSLFRWSLSGVGRDALTGFETSGIAYVIGELVIKL
jgi:hypothetical protein